MVAGVAVLVHQSFDWYARRQDHERIRLTLDELSERSAATLARPYALRFR